jgi:hypothetical protein
MASFQQQITISNKELVDLLLDDVGSEPGNLAV